MKSVACLLEASGLSIAVGLVQVKPFMPMSTLVSAGWNVLGGVETDGEPNPCSHWFELEKPKHTHRVFFNRVEPLTPELFVKALGEKGILVV